MISKRFDCNQMKELFPNLCKILWSWSYRCFEMPGRCRESNLASLQEHPALLVHSSFSSALRVLVGKEWVFKRFWNILLIGPFRFCDEVYSNRIYECFVAAAVFMWSWSLIPECFICYPKHMLCHWALPQPLFLLLKPQLTVGVTQFDFCQLNKWYHILIYYTCSSPEWRNVSALGMVEVICTQCKHFHDKMYSVKKIFLVLYFKCMCVHFSVPHAYRYLESPEEGIWSLEAGVTIGCNSPVPISIGNQTQFLFKSSKHFLRLSHLCSPWRMVLYNWITENKNPTPPHSSLSLSQ